MLRGVRDALVDLARDLLDRALPLREQIDDLRPPSASQRLRNRRQRVEQGRFRRTTRHILKVSLEYLKNYAVVLRSNAAARHSRRAPDRESTARVPGARDQSARR